MTATRGLAAILADDVAYRGVNPDNTA